MDERNRNQNDTENKMKTFKNINQSALNYVQSAIENTAAETDDATQNLVNQIMKNQVP
jgi:flagellar motor switch protein FliG